MTGQASTQPPQSMHVSASITCLPPCSLIAFTGQTSSHAPQLMQSSLIECATVSPPIKIIKPYPTGFIFSITHQKQLSSKENIILFHNHFQQQQGFSSRHRSLSSGPPSKPADLVASLALHAFWNNSSDRKSSCVSDHHQKHSRQPDNRFGCLTGIAFR